MRQFARARGWALTDFGFKAAIATSFADIFRNNSLKNGFLPIILKPEEVDAIFAAIKEHDGYELTIDLPAQTISDKFGWSAHFDIDPFPKKCFLEGLDDVALTLSHDKEIAAYEKIIRRPIVCSPQRSPVVALARPHPGG